MDKLENVLSPDNPQTSSCALEKMEDLDITKEKAVSEGAQELSRTANINIDEIDAEDAVKLKGDSIGSTLYSQKFVLTTLLKLENVEWSEEFEDELCFLWDSTAEEDVCLYLFELDFPSIVCSLIMNQDRKQFSRLMEIAIGILGNMLASKCNKKISNEHIKVVLDLLFCEDTFILTQVLRCFSALAFDFEDLSFVKGETIAMLMFILRNSLNRDILIQTLDVTAKLTTNMKLDESLLTGDLVLGVLSAARGVLTTESDNATSSFEVSVVIHQSCTKSILGLVCNYAVYINNNINQRLLAESSKFVEPFLNFVTVLLDYYSNKHILLPLTDEIIFYFEAINYVFRTLFIPFREELLVKVTRILRLLIEDQCPNIEEFVETFCYFVFIMQPDLLLTVLHKKKNKKACKTRLVVDYILDKKYDFGFDYRTNLEYLANYLHGKQQSEDKYKKN